MGRGEEGLSDFGFLLRRFGDGDAANSCWSVGDPCCGHFLTDGLDLWIEDGAKQLMLSSCFYDTSASFLKVPVCSPGSRFPGGESEGGPAPCDHRI